MPAANLTDEQHEAVFEAVLQALRHARPELFEPPTLALDPGGLVELDSHIDALVAIVRRTTSQKIEPYLAQILEDICSQCHNQYPSGFCSLRHRKLCVLYTCAEPIIGAIRASLGQASDTRR